MLLVGIGYAFLWRYFVWVLIVIYLCCVLLERYELVVLLFEFSVGAFLLYCSRCDV